MKNVILIVTLSFLALVSQASDFTAYNSLANIKNELFDKQIKSISAPIDARTLLKGRKIVAFKQQNVNLIKFDRNMLAYKKAIKIEFAKQIKAGDFYGHYRIIQYMDGTFAALFHLGEFGNNQYIPCFCHLKNGEYRISGTVRVTGFFADKQAERLIVFKLPTLKRE